MHCRTDVLKCLSSGVISARMVARDPASVRSGHSSSSKFLNFHELDMYSAVTLCVYLTQREDMQRL